MATIYAPLTPREKDVAHRLARGYSQKEIASELGLNIKTILRLIDRLRMKTFMDSTSRLIVYLYRNGYGQQ